MMGNADYILVLICPGLEGYCAMAEYFVHSKLIENNFGELIIQDPELAAYLDRHYPDWSEKGTEAIAVSDFLFEIAQAFPPPFSHRDVMHGNLPDRPPEEWRALFQQADQWRQMDSVKIHVTVKSPEKMPLPKKMVRKFLEENYKPLIFELAGHEDFVPDDFEATEALLKGEPDLIWPETRTFTAVFPLRDVTNSIQLVQVFDRPQLPRIPADLPKDPHFLTVDIAHPECLHLFSLLFGEAAMRHGSTGMQWSLFTVSA